MTNNNTNKEYLDSFRDIYKKEVQDELVDKLLMRTAVQLSEYEEKRKVLARDADAYEWARRQVVHDTGDALSLSFSNHFNDVSNKIAFDKRMVPSTLSQLSNTDITNCERHLLEEYLKTENVTLETLKEASLSECKTKKTEIAPSALEHEWGDRYCVHTKIQDKKGKFKSVSHWERKCFTCDITQRWGKQWGTRKHPQYDDNVSKFCLSK